MRESAVPLAETFLRCAKQRLPLCRRIRCRHKAFKHQFRLRQAITCEGHQRVDILWRIAQGGQRPCLIKGRTGL
ncbi:MAG: hypothetical protein ACFWT4_22300 [Citrobacter braakii]